MLTRTDNSNTPNRSTGASVGRRWPESLAIVLLVAAIWVPRGLLLDRFVTIDENKWVTRSANFYTALAQGDFADTFQQEHPGVTTMWAGTGGLVRRFPAYKDISPGQVEPDEYRRLLETQGYSVVELLAAGRFFMVLANTIALSLAFLFARRLLGLLPAFVGFLLIALDPFHTAHSRFLHLDALLSSFLLLALLAFLSFLHSRRLSHLLVSGFAAALSWLTKSPGAFLIPAVVLLAAFDAWSHGSDSGGTHFSTRAWQFVWPLAIWTLVAIAVFVALWPAMWVDPFGTLSQVLAPALDSAAGGHENPIFFNGQVYSDGRVLSPWFYPLTFLWRTTPIVLAGLLFSAVAFAFKHEPLNQPKTRRTVASLVLFVIVFTLLQNLGTKKFDRYLLPVYAPLDLVAAMGWVAAAAWLKTRRQSLIRQYAPPLLLVALLLVQTVGTLQTFPYYLSYYNPVMGGSSRAPEVMQIGWGEGLDQAARYLDGQKNSHNLKVAAWYYERSFYHFFSGSSRPIPLQHDISPAQLQDVLGSDYIVIYIHQWQRQTPRQLLSYLAQLTPVHSIWIDGLEYARIYKPGVPDRPPEPAQLVAEGNLGNLARLVGYDPPPPLQAPLGTSLPLTLTWECLGIFDADYTVFIHLVGPDKRPLAQADSQPLSGAYPTTRWDVGERLADPYRLSIPVDLPPGDYDLLVGMYLLSTGQRLSLLRADGQVLGDSISLRKVTITKP
jgi:hypothetical protein